ncbi:CPBP family intramembrane glutamic endopeptidase [Paenibacillus sp. FSL R10-2736]|uniref:CPBP family intramembrane glutamic endopeptidase n=1 Tax=Paenibacillus sp. FSL R10-2736 TaxID=2954692 RepID=UPI0030F5E773
MQLETGEHAGIFTGKRISAWFIVGLIILEIIFAMTVNLLFFEKGTFDDINRLTHGWINATLCAGLLGLMVIVIIYLWAMGRIPLRDLGLRREKLLAGCLWTFVFWLAVNVMSACINLIAGTALTWNHDLADFPNLFLGALLGQLFGNALLEEIIFRGFLFVQIHHWLSGTGKPSSRIVKALLISQTVFALMHIPNRIYGGLSGMEFVYDFIQLVILGMLFALLYVLTRNLFIVVGVHSLLNVNLVIWTNSYATTASLTCMGFAIGILLLLRRKKVHNRKSVIHY